MVFLGVSCLLSVLGGCADEAARVAFVDHVCNLFDLLVVGCYHYGFSLGFAQVQQ